MNKFSELYAANGGSMENGFESGDLKRKVKGAKNQMIIQNQVNLMKRSFNINNTLDVVFNDLKNNLKEEAKNSVLAELADEINKDSNTNKMRENQEKFECVIGNNFRTALTVNDETEKNNLMYLSSKVDEEEKALMEYLKSH